MQKLHKYHLIWKLYKGKQLIKKSIKKIKYNRGKMFKSLKFTIKSKSHKKIFVERCWKQRKLNKGIFRN